jgi:hypothetical protein
MEPLKREFWTGLHKAIEDEVARRKPCGGQWRKGLYLRGKAGNKSQMWQKIEPGEDVCRRPMLQWELQEMSQV